ncbi:MULTISPECIES: Vms1/Ankzf1 family peptidyl-tRNA hydrolase [unclassified Curtobacterium]|uniref:baeRF2 domain-containing protein n=1 Tax=unclassified Curtobacterium TaxID=257496 RepID=UPI003817FAA7
MTSTNVTNELHRVLGQRLEGGGTWAWAYVDASANVEDPRRQAALKLRAVEEALRAQGSDLDAVDVIAGELEDTPGIPAPVARYVLVHDGELVLSEVLPGPMHAAESIGAGAVPDLVPLVAHRPIDLPFLVVQVGKDGGGYRAYKLGHPGNSDDEERIQGETFDQHKVKGGFGDWKQPRWQGRTEEIWRQNTTEVASAIDKAVERLSPALIVVSGDLQARPMLIDRLSSDARRLVSEVPGGGFDEAVVGDHVRVALARVIAGHRHDLEDSLRTHVGRGDNQAVTGLGPVVEALQQAQGSTIALDAVAIGDRTLLALGTAPWVATAPEQAAGAPVIGPVPAVCALVRAAVLTDAELVLVNAASLPGGAAAAALLRWPVGPTVPA